MWNFLKSIFMFRVGQKTYRGMARGVGLSRLAMIAGLVGGYRYMRRSNTHV
jgi:phenylalanyl-tRNA synthetase alpha subunit